MRPLRQDSLLAPFWEAFGTPSGPERGLEEHLKNSFKNHSIWEPLLGAFWGHVGTKIESIGRPLGPQLGLRGVLKSTSKIALTMTPFWDPFWMPFGVMLEPK